MKTKGPWSWSLVLLGSLVLPTQAGPPTDSWEVEQIHFYQLISDDGWGNVSINLQASSSAHSITWVYSAVNLLSVWDQEDWEVYMVLAGVKNGPLSTNTYFHHQVVSEGVILGSQTWGINYQSGSSPSNSAYLTTSLLPVQFVSSRCDYDEGINPDNGDLHWSTSCYYRGNTVPEPSALGLLILILLACCRRLARLV